MRLKNVEDIISGTDKYKLIISILMGFLCLIGSFFSVSVPLNNFTLNFVSSQVFIILVTIAWGRYYGLISLTLGLGSTYSFIVWGNGGWVCLVSFITMFIWVVMLGDKSICRESVKGIDRKIYRVQIFYSIIVIILHLTILPLMLIINKVLPPFWAQNPIISINIYTLNVLIIKTIVGNFLILAVSDSILLTPFTRKIFLLRVEKYSRRNTLILIFSLIMGSLIFISIVVMKYIIINKASISFSLLYDKLQTIRMTLVFIFSACFIFGGQIARNYQENLKSMDKIKELNSSLERKVSERTNQLQSAMTELEAFNYTVSHDLKSPLRSIVAYCHFIQEDYGDKLDQDLLTMILNIEHISNDMIDMIKKLLEYTTLTKKDALREQLNMKECVRLLFDELKVADNGKPMELIFDNELPDIMGDRILINEILTNILSNSIKFSRTKEKTIIHVGYESTQDEDVFYIKDNGIGLNMEYSGKLYNVFQRLHSKEEYEGSGIGLATVRKIVQIYGGRSWIVGKENEGATVYFTFHK